MRDRVRTEFERDTIQAYQTIAIYHQMRAGKGRMPKLSKFMHTDTTSRARPTTSARTALYQLASLYGFPVRTDPAPAGKG